MAAGRLGAVLDLDVGRSGAGEVVAVMSCRSRCRGPGISAYGSCSLAPDRPILSLVSVVRVGVSASGPSMSDADIDVKRLTVHNNVLTFA